MGQIAECRQVKISAVKLITSGVTCPFCGVDNVKSRWEHFSSVYEPQIRSGLTGTPIGDYVYQFKKKLNR